jgi:hypothetical protein
MPDTIHLVFKTHLDIGFTDYAANVVRKYRTQFIPQAIALAAQTRETGAHFRWTVGAWLIYNYLEQASSAERLRMEQAIAAGDIVWHALPFTTHTELMDESLFRYGLSYSRRLDARFGRKTIAGKMTDVPGHTRAMVPLLHEAGVRLLHLGVNPVSAVPDVPPVFLWRDLDSKTEVCVIYDPTYGGVTRVGGLSDVLAVILTGDNEGPPSVDEVQRQYVELREQNPGAQVIASTMDAFAAPLWEARASLPIVTSEIGDTWIHGAGTDPAKVARYRALSRLRRHWLTRDLSATERKAVDAFADCLILVPEHTWGMDEKTHLPDHSRYTRADLAELRAEPRTQAFERSWAEQREYLTAAVAALDDETGLEDEAHEDLNDAAPLGRIRGRKEDLVNALLLKNLTNTILIDSTNGAVIGWTGADGTAVADPAHPLATLSYTVYGREDYERYWSQYIRHGDRPDYQWWAREDNMKIGMPIERTQTWTPRGAGLYRYKPNEGVVRLEFPDDARSFGAPESVQVQYVLAEDKIDIRLTWHAKPANRIAEAFWLSFNPIVADPSAWRFEKMGRWIDPQDVVSRGARSLHAVDQRVICGDEFELKTLDAPLVAPGKPSLLDFHNQLPDMRGGVHVCLYNNIWGTNFPMWYEDDAKFRFSLRVPAAAR